MGRDHRVRIHEEEMDQIDKIAYLLFDPDLAGDVPRGKVVSRAAEAIVEQEADDPDEFAEMTLEEVEAEYDAG